MLNMFVERDATFSPCRTYRYLLWRTWDPLSDPLNFLMLNPSTADETVNDPTVERCERWADSWGFGGLVVTNIFAYRATDPSDMLAAPDPVGPGNDDAILEAAREASQVICAWGNHGSHRRRSDDVLRLLRGIETWCLGVNGTGEPVHPLYQPGDVKPIPYNSRGK